MPLPVYIACVGSRETPSDILAWMEATGAELVRRGFSISTGNATGADQAWARGANSVDPTKVKLCLPWRNYERQAIVQGNMVVVLDELAPDVRNHFSDIAARLHPAGMNGGSRWLHARNVMIVKPAIAVVGYLNPFNIGGGGTGMAFRAARHFNIPAHNVADETVRDAVLDELKLR